MTALEQALSDYLRLRRGLGYYLERDQGELERFVEFLQQAHAERISTELAVQWARMPATQHPVIWRKRLSTVRGFARYLATVDPASEIPSTDLLRAHQPRTAPYIYTVEEITDLMAAARSLPRPLAAATFATVIGLLACTGLRLREALALDRSDVDLETGVLNIPASKNHRQREVLLHRARPPRWRTTSRCETGAAPSPPRRRSSSPVGSDGRSRRCSGRRSGS